MVRKIDLAEQVVVELGATTPPPSSVKRDTSTLRVMTYNIHNGVGTDGRYDLERIASVIAAEDPDIVALQEIEQYRTRTRGDDQPAILARLLNMDCVFAPIRTACLRDSHHEAAYGNAIFSRVPIQSQELFMLSYGDTLEPRGCLHVTVGAEQKPLHLFCVHLGLRYRERHYQVERLLSEDVVNSPRFGAGSKILMGDFNNWWPVKSARQLHTHFENACIVTGRRRHSTFGRFIQLLCLDYIFASRDLEVTSYHVVREGAARVASDHRPVVASVTQRAPKDMNGSLNQAAASMISGPLSA